MISCVETEIHTIEAREAEHADLISDVLPSSWGAQSLQFGLQLSSHQQHPVGHRLNISFPVQSKGKSLMCNGIYVLFTMWDLCSCTIQQRDLECWVLWQPGELLEMEG